jgi:hypothetical protein
MVRRQQPVSEDSELRYVTLRRDDVMLEGAGSFDLKRRDQHVALFAMHNALKTTFRDTIRVRAMLTHTGVTHISTMNRAPAANCLGHNPVEFRKDVNVYPVLYDKRSCPSTVIWDYNFAPGGYIDEAYKSNLYTDQLAGFFKSGAHMVIMPNWVTRIPAHSHLDRDISTEQTRVLLDGTMSFRGVTCRDALAALTPGSDIQQLPLSALEAETLHPLVVATKKARRVLLQEDRKATWSVNKCYIGEQKAFIVFYDVMMIRNPREHLLKLSTRR